MLFFFGAHFFNDRTTFRVVFGQALEVAVEVGADLLLGLRDETEAPPIAEHTACGANRECARLPDRAQATRARVEFREPLFTPGQVVELLVCRALHLFFGGGITRHCRVALVEALGGNFTRVIDAHEAGSMSFLLVAELAIGNVCGRAYARRSTGRGGNRSERVVGARE